MSILGGAYFPGFVYPIQVLLDKKELSLKNLCEYVKMKKL